MKLKGYGKLRKNEKFYVQYTSKCSAIEVQELNIPRAICLKKSIMYLMHHSESPNFEAQKVSFLFLKHSDVVSDTVMESKK